VASIKKSLPTFVDNFVNNSISKGSLFTF